MALIECVFCKARHLLEYFFCNSGFNAIFDCTVYEAFTLCLHCGVFFLRHSASYDICLSIGVACKASAYLHYLLLVYDATIRYSEYRLKLWQLINRFFSTMLSGNKCIDRVHRTGTIQRNTSYNVLKTVWLKLLKHLSHST